MHLKIIIIVPILVITFGLIYVSNTPNLAQALNVTSGEVIAADTERFIVESPQQRAYFRESSGNSAALSFMYLGPTEEVVPFASGQVRRQLGLKLRAPDACNTLYVMWHLEPDEGIVVSTKHNPGQSESSECGAEGYERVTTVEYEDEAPVVAPGNAHSLRAILEDSKLRVFVDDRLVWLGTVPTERLANRGQAGMRTDNVMVEFTPQWDEQLQSRKK